MARLTINGTVQTLDVPPETSLLNALRDELGLTGTKYGCGLSQCGACTVHVNGDAVRACQTYVRDLGDARVTTIEGVSGPVADAVRAAWLEHDVAQCGYCQPGQIMQAIALLTRQPNPDDAAITAAMNGNLCRCGTYGRIRAAIRSAARMLSLATEGAEP
ncbi:(2Fe-2S)-binding protein [Roseospira marina]|uniref:(2Fe-2S)-binding protein n=1 Tax=Roseospira marina TaxID=140057 RepID=A0A5M6IEG4_9PROT|nr:(2Fe-2S)-binding protein [Roseospira marina]KAA5606492.1 (2Fe-2S)-binding protein [Roseospira marina]MBB4314087.1 isoquinoline 1-oxidoreductase alpha subunit [Roseospira marina]MBB5087248.1 isoquinoline 1-oxidoreductase alpha subunit [Roseospira marina]